MGEAVGVSGDIEGIFDGKPEGYSDAVGVVDRLPDGLIEGNTDGFCIEGRLDSIPEGDSVDCGDDGRLDGVSVTKDFDGTLDGLSDFASAVGTSDGVKLGEDESTGAPVEG